MPNKKVAENFRHQSGATVIIIYEKSIHRLWMAVPAEMGICDPG